MRTSANHPVRPVPSPTEPSPLNIQPGPSIANLQPNKISTTSPNPANRSAQGVQGALEMSREPHADRDPVMKAIKDSLFRWTCERHATDCPLDRHLLRDKAMELAGEYGLTGTYSRNPRARLRRVFEVNAIAHEKDEGQLSLVLPRGDSRADGQQARHAIAFCWSGLANVPARYFLRSRALRVRPVLQIREIIHRPLSLGCVDFEE